MAKLIIPNNEDPMVRNFHKVVVFDPAGKLQDHYPFHGTMVLTQCNGERQLAIYKESHRQLPSQWEKVAFWVLLLIWSTQILDKF